jgi:hypothetical protein
MNVSSPRSRDSAKQESASSQRRAGSVSSSVTFALALLTLVAIAVPRMVRWAYRYWNVELIQTILAFVVPMIGLLVLTALQQRRDPARTSFRPAPLAVAATIVAAGALATSFLGYLALLADLILIPLAAMFLSVAWVQPPEEREVVVALTGEALVPFDVWFAGRADENANEAMISGSCIALLVTTLFLFRRHARKPVSC